MLNGISWNLFFVCLGGLTLVYYAVVTIVYYRHDVVNLLRGRRQPPTSSGKAAVLQSFPEQADDYYLQSDEEPMLDEYDEVNRITDDIGDIFVAAHAERWDRQKLLDILNRKLTGHFHLAGTPYETSINNYIAIQADRSGFTHFSADELRGVWKNG